MFFLEMGNRKNTPFKKGLAKIYAGEKFRRVKVIDESCSGLAGPTQHRGKLNKQQNEQCGNRFCSH
jgi:hypothetical protein